MSTLPTKADDALDLAMIQIAAAGDLNDGWVAALALLLALEVDDEEVCR